MGNLSINILINGYVEEDIEYLTRDFAHVEVLESKGTIEGLEDELRHYGVRSAFMEGDGDILFATGEEWIELFCKDEDSATRGLKIVSDWLEENK